MSLPHWTAEDERGTYNWQSQGYNNSTIYCRWRWATPGDRLLLITNRRGKEKPKLLKSSTSTVNADISFLEGNKQPVWAIQIYIVGRSYLLIAWMREYWNAVVIISDKSATFGKFENRNWQSNGEFGLLWMIYIHSSEENEREKSSSLNDSVQLRMLLYNIQMVGAKYLWNILIFILHSRSWKSRCVANW